MTRCLSLLQSPKATPKGACTHPTSTGDPPEEDTRGTEMASGRPVDWRGTADVQMRPILGQTTGWFQVVVGDGLTSSTLFQDDPNGTRTDLQEQIVGFMTGSEEDR